MSTIVTPRLQRTYDYAFQETSVIHPEAIPALTEHFQRMLDADTPERLIIRFLLEVLLALLLCDQA